MCLSAARLSLNPSPLASTSHSPFPSNNNNNNHTNAQDHTELEVLLESFSKQVEEIVNEAESLEHNVQATQEIVELVLDANRNALLALDLKVSIMTLGVGAGALVAGVFGMNVRGLFLFWDEMLFGGLETRY